MPGYISIDNNAFIPVFLTAVAIISYLWLRPKDKQPLFMFSTIDDFKLAHKTRGKAYFSSLPQALTYLSLAIFLIALTDPHLSTDKNKSSDKSTSGKNNEPLAMPTEGIAIYILADQSGSMSEYVEATTPEGKNDFLPKMSLLKKVTTQFIEGDQGRSELDNDLIGLIAFARAARVLSPLTLDHSVILDQLDHLSVVTQPDEDGTAMGYAIYKTVSLITATKHFGEDLIKRGKPAYTIKNSIIIVVTDGFQYPSPLDKGKRLRNIGLNEAARYAKENGVRLYIANIDPGIVNEEFAPQRNQMKRITELTGGKFYMLTNDTNLPAIYQDINQLERSTLPNQEILTNKNKQPNAENDKSLNYRSLSFYPYLIVLGMLCLAGALILQTTTLRQIP